MKNNDGIVSVLKDGRYVPWTPLDFRCEVDGCGETKHVREYIRKPEEFIAGWEGEPIYLCRKHSVGRKWHIPND